MSTYNTYDIGFWADRVEWLTSFLVSWLISLTIMTKFGHGLAAQICMISFIALVVHLSRTFKKIKPIYHYRGATWLRQLKIWSDFRRREIVLGFWAISIIFPFVNPHTYICLHVGFHVWIVRTYLLPYINSLLPSKPKEKEEEESPRLIPISQDDEPSPPVSQRQLDEDDSDSTDSSDSSDSVESDDEEMLQAVQRVRERSREEAKKRRRQKKEE